MVKPGTVIYNKAINQEIRFVKTAAETGGSLLEMESVYRGPSGKPFEHYHPAQDETFTVQEGELTVLIRGEQITLKSGDRIDIPRNTVHAMWNAFAGNTRVTWEVKPALQTAEFLDSVFKASEKSAKGVPPPLQMVLLLRHYSGEFRLSKISFGVQKLLFSVLAPIARMVGHRI